MSRLFAESGPMLHTDIEMTVSRGHHEFDITVEADVDGEEVTSLVAERNGCEFALTAEEEREAEELLREAYADGVADLYDSAMCAACDRQEEADRGDA